MTFWIDTHCHLDAQDFWPPAHTRQALVATENIVYCVIPAIHVANFDAVRNLAHSQNHSYALGIHPLSVAHAHDDDVAILDATLNQYQDDVRLVAVGEIGLDFFDAAINTGILRERQEFFFHEQLKLARRYHLPVLLHTRKSVDHVLQGLRREAPALGWRGIAHAFNGSWQQATAFLNVGLKLGFGGALTYPRALHLRQLATALPLSAMVLETDAPDMPPQWLYKTAAQRAAREPQGINSPAELPRIGMELAALRAISADDLAKATTHNALQALPKLVDIDQI